MKGRLFLLAAGVVLAACTAGTNNSAPPATGGTGVIPAAARIPAPAAVPAGPPTSVGACALAGGGPPPRTTVPGRVAAGAAQALLGGWEGRVQYGNPPAFNTPPWTASVNVTQIDVEEGQIRVSLVAGPNPSNPAERIDLQAQRYRLIGAYWVRHGTQFPVVFYLADDGSLQGAWVGPSSGRCHIMTFVKRSSSPTS